MRKSTLSVPEGTKYLSGWRGFFDALPITQHFILDKKICGCGATEAFLRTDKKVILASPRKHLLYDKFKQHLPEKFHLYRWADDKDKYFTGRPTEAEAIQFDKNLTNYIDGGGTKILVPYDSIQKIKKAIGNDNLNDWIVVVDEFQALFTDCQYKAETERQFCEELKAFSSVIYLSATPFLEEYLDDVSLFSSLLICELEWGADRMEIPKVIYTELKNSSTKKKCCEIIEQYKKGQGPIKGGVQSEEAVFYINNVREIVQIIKAAKLKPEEVNILCSSTSDNLRKLKSIGKGFKMGDIPEEGEPHKMFTFCTSTVYLGADFYSTNACTYIFANPNIKSMAVDVSIDLQQILGRQRLESNPFRNSATLFYTTKAGQDKSELDQVVKEKKEATQQQIENFNAAPHKNLAADLIRENIEKYNHSNHYCCLVEDADHNLILEENELLIASERRAWEITSKIYQSEFSMYCALKGGVDAKAEINSKDRDLQILFDEWIKDASFSRKAQMYCQMYEDIPEVLDQFKAFIPKKYQEYHDALGYDGMKAHKWRESDIKKVIQEANSNIPIDHGAVYSEIIKRVEVGKKYTKEKLKDMLKDIYKKLGIPGIPSASSVSNYITVKETSTRVSGKKVAMFEVQSLYRKNVSLFPVLGRTDNGQTYDIDSVLQIIKKSNYFRVKETVDKVRNSTMPNKAKLSLPLVCWNGVFTSRGNLGLGTYSSFTALDFDKVADMNGKREWLKTFPSVYAIFTTPSGKGLKAIILHDNFNPAYHYNMYKELLNLFKCPEIDDKTKDLGRGNFLSYDPDIWINPSPIPYHFEVKADEQIEGPDVTFVADKNTQGDILVDDSEVNCFLNKLCRQLISDESVIKILKSRWTKKAIQGGRNNAAMSYAGILCQAGVEKEKAREVIQELIPGFDISEIMDYAYTHNIFASRRKNYCGRKK